MAVPTRKSVNSNDVTKFAKVVLVIWIAMTRRSRNVSKTRGHDLAPDWKIGHDEYHADR